MFNLIPALVSVAVSGVAKMMTSSTADGAMTTGTSATVAGAKTGAAADGKSAASGFQNLLDAQTHAQTPAQTGAQPAPPNSISPELLANMITDGDGHPGQGLRGRSIGDKTDTAVAAAADLASLIGASVAAANPAAVQAASGAANLAARAQEPRPDAAGAFAAGVDARRPTAAAAGSALLAAARGSATTGEAAGANAPTSDANSFAALQAALRVDQAQVTAKPRGAGELAAVRSETALPQSLAAQTAGGTPANANTNSIPGARLDMPVGTQGWDRALGQRVVWMVSQKDQTAELHVNPPELGPLTVTVNVSDNNASASFVAPHAATREAIADAMPRLRDMFADAGINLGQVSVSAESFNQGNGAGQAFHNRQESGGQIAGPASVGGVSGPLSPVKTSRAQLGLVDTFA